MATLKTMVPSVWAVTPEYTKIDKSNLWTRYLALADGQKENRTLWFFISLTFHGVFLLPIPAVLMYYYHAPVLILAITMTCFFTNLIANMGGAVIRYTLSFFAISVLTHLAMLAVFVH